MIVFGCGTCDECAARKVAIRNFKRIKSWVSAQIDIGSRDALKAYNEAWSRWDSERYARLPRTAKVLPAWFYDSPAYVVDAWKTYLVARVRPDLMRLLLQAEVAYDKVTYPLWLACIERSKEKGQVG